MRRKKVYTPIGKKIADLAKNQVEIGKVLGLTQQSVSGKLRGSIALSIADLEQLSIHYKVNIIYFFLPEDCAQLVTQTIGKLVQRDKYTRTLINNMLSMPDYMVRYMASTFQAVSGLTRDMKREEPEKFEEFWKA